MRISSFILLFIVGTNVAYGGCHIVDRYDVNIPERIEGQSATFTEMHAKRIETVDYVDRMEAVLEECELINADYNAIVHRMEIAAERYNQALEEFRQRSETIIASGHTE